MDRECQEALTQFQRRYGIIVCTVVYSVNDCRLTVNKALILKLDLTQLLLSDSDLQYAAKALCISKASSII